MLHAVGKRNLLKCLISHFEVENEQVLCRIAPWEFFRDTFASFVGCYKITQEQSSVKRTSK